MKLVAFDLEGPLSPQDNAYDLMGLFPGGRHIFETLSRYDDLLTLERKPGYEPGDTLSLIVPFLFRHRITEDHIRMLAGQATLVNGARELVHGLLEEDWQVFCITTTYRQYSEQIVRRLGIPDENLAATCLPLEKLGGTPDASDVELVDKLEHTLENLAGEKDEVIKAALDRFYWEQLPETGLGRVMAEVKAVGGRRKVQALERFAARLGQPLSEWAAVGDSITDFRMFQAVDGAGGLAVAFNANEYALPYATMGLASTFISDLLPALQAWATAKRPEVARFLGGRTGTADIGDRNHFTWIAGTHLAAKALRTHRRIRALVRESAAKLG